MDLIDIKKELIRASQDINLINEEFICACERGSLEIVKYLLTSPELKECADIHANNDEGFRFACKKGYLDVIKYILTSPELTEHADVHACDDQGFQFACANGYLDIVSYLLTSPDLKEHADIHVGNDFGFRIAYMHDSFNVIKFLLEYNKSYQDKYSDTVENLVNKGYVDFILYLKKEIQESEECEIFL